MMSAVTEELPSLAAMIRRKHEEGYTFREMERRARQHGYKLSHSTFADLAKESVARMPEADDLAAIAAALGVPVTEVHLAAYSQFYGYMPDVLQRIASTSVAAAVPPDLTPEERAELVRMVQAWAAARRPEDP